MSGSSLTGMSSLSLLDLFREEVRAHGSAFVEALSVLRGDFANVQKIEPLMRAAHSIKGAARIVNVEPAVLIAGVLEEAMTAAMKGTVTLNDDSLPVVQRGIDRLVQVAGLDEAEFDRWLPTKNPDVGQLLEELRALASGKPLPREASVPEQPAGALTTDYVPASPPASSVADSSQHSLLDLFRVEVQEHSSILSEGLVALEEDPLNPRLIEPLMRAAHSIKGAARIVNLEAAVQVAHVMEDVLVAAQEGELQLSSNDIDLLLRGTDRLGKIAETLEQDFDRWLPANNPDVRELIGQLRVVATGKPVPPPSLPASPNLAETATLTAPVVPATPPKIRAEGEFASRPEVNLPRGPIPSKAFETAAEASLPGAAPRPAAAEERVVRVTAQNLSKLMSLAGESLVEARWLQPFAKSLMALKQHQDHLAVVLEEMQQSLALTDTRSATARLLQESRQRIYECRELLADRIGEFEQHARQSDDLNSRLYHEVIASRMRPFADGVQGFPRLVRDLARKLGKKVKLEISGHKTDVDRDILEKLEAPLNHLVRNAIDHGLETPEQRVNVGKPEQGTLRLEARHRAGMLSITITDDGRGISLERLRRRVIERGMSTPELVSAMNESELFNFLFLPGFSTSERVTEVSGRGVGLDVVHSMVTAVGGSVRVSSKLGSGTTFHLQLPITLSVLRAVLVTIGGEPYAFPHNRIDRLLRLPHSDIRTLEGRQYFSVDGRNVGLVMAQQVFNLEMTEPPGTDLCVVLISDHQSEFGVVVDRFQGEQDLVVRPLDTRLGKVPSVSAAALLEDGSPVLIVDVDDFVRSIDGLLQGGRLRRAATDAAAAHTRKRILVVDDSITVREAERQLLVNRGYEVAVAVDGMDGWNAIRDDNFDLVVSDIDMPRMNGLDFVKNIKQDPRLKSTPVVIVSYKGREEDRLKGLEAGADYYLTKASFHDDTLLEAVVDLIGDPE